LRASPGTVTIRRAEPIDRRADLARALALAWAMHDTERFFEAARDLSRR
jgi:hypothetical protein